MNIVNCKGALTVIALGPLTNLALAIRLNPDINFRQIFIMGGNINGEMMESS